MYCIATLCYGERYEPILEHWMKRIKDRCPATSIYILNNIPVPDDLVCFNGINGFIWTLRFNKMMNLLNKINMPVVMCDVDVIIEKDLSPLVELPYDVVISTEIGGSKAYPQHCSSRLGFGVCAGFTIIKPSAKPFIDNVYNNMKTGKYRTYDDQINLMEHIVNAHTSIEDVPATINGIEYQNKIINIDNIKICVLDFRLVVRDPVNNTEQFANHINIDNVGGTDNFIKFFYEDWHNLPMTCRCGKLGDTNVCTHKRD